MTLYVSHIGILLVGKPHAHPAKKHIEAQIKDHTLDTYLKNLNPIGKRFIIDALENFQAVMWGGKAIPQGTKIRESLIKHIVPIIEKGEISDNLDYNQLINELGVPNRDYLELNLFDLLQDIGEQELSLENSNQIF